MSVTSNGEKLKVFISYSRRDAAEFSDELVAGLELAGFAPFLDRHDIAAGEDWEVRLGRLIVESDTVVFVVSPEAVQSDRCIWEVNRTVELSKRLLPVIFKPVPDADIPENLRRLQFVRFDTGRALTRSIAELAEALRVDLDWIREHTRVGELAARWNARGRPESLLLRSDDIDAAKSWSVRRKSEAPAISDLQRVFLNASEIAEGVRLEKERVLVATTARLRRRAGMSLWSVGVLILGISTGLAWSNRIYLQARAVTLVEAVWPKVLSAEQEHTLPSGQRFKECTHCPEMVIVPAGEFMMGSFSGEIGHQTGEEPQHRVSFKQRFAVSRFEITSEEWDACVLLGGCSWPAPETGWGRGRRPVMNVSWDDARQYVAWLSKRTGKTYRLLSEAEWEYAARGGKQTAYFWGDEIGKNNANCQGCGSPWDGKQTAPVGSFAANAFGLNDMHGNVWEWVEDCAHPNYGKNPPTDGSPWLVNGDGDCGSHVVRGSSWIDLPANLRSAHRGRSKAAGRDNDLGFRVARTLAP